MSKRRSVYVIELLVVIAIVAILQLPLPAFPQRHGENTRRAASDTKQLGLATLMYADDYDVLCRFRLTLVG